MNTGYGRMIGQGADTRTGKSPAAMDAMTGQGRCEATMTGQDCRSNDCGEGRQGQQVQQVIEVIEVQYFALRVSSPPGCCQVWRRIRPGLAAGLPGGPPCTMAPTYAKVRHKFLCHKGWRIFEYSPPAFSPLRP